MVFGLIGAGLQIAQGVKGLVDAKKGAKGDGGEKAPAQGAKANGPGGAANGAGRAEATIDRFLKLLDQPNVRTLADIKGVRDRVMGAIQKNGLDPQGADNAKKKLNHAILKKLGIGRPGPNGSIEVQLTPRVRQVLAALGMPPDQVRNQAGPAAPRAGPAQAARPAAIR